MSTKWSADETDAQSASIAEILTGILAAIVGMLWYLVGGR